MKLIILVALILGAAYCAWTGNNYRKTEMVEWYRPASRTFKYWAGAVAMMIVAAIVTYAG